jgi:hypothetical protein
VSPATQHASRLALARGSLLSSAALRLTVGGGARGIALAVAGRYDVPYSRAIACVGPATLRATVELLQECDDGASVAALRRFVQLGCIADSALGDGAPPASIADVVRGCSEDGDPHHVLQRLSEVLRCVRCVYDPWYWLQRYHRHPRHCNHRNHHAQPQHQPQPQPQPPDDCAN